MDNLPTPLNRVELYLATAAQMPGVTPPEEPLSRLEQYLAFIAGDTSIELPAPASLCEQWLAYIAGITPAEPLKLEGAFHVGVQKVDVRFFAVAAGMPGVVAPEPQNRTEQYWARLAEILPVHGVLKYATGTNITLTDVAWWKMGLERINGDTTQQTYTGKNLLHLANGGSGGVSGTVNQDGTITIAGKATGTGGYPIFADETHSWSAGKYTATISKELPFVINYTITSGINFRFSPGTTSVTITLSEDYEGLCHFYAAITSGETYDETFSMQIVSGENPDYDFEPYVGGVPAPNPNYPQAINTVTGEQTVTVQGKNLFDLEQAATVFENAEGVVYTGGASYSDGVVTMTWTTGAHGRRYMAGFEPTLVEGETYTLSAYVYITGTHANSNVSIGSLSTWSSVAAGGKNAWYRVSKTFTATSTDVADSRMMVQPANTGNTMKYKDVQLEQGSTATDFQPYQKTEYKIDFNGKNMFNKAEALTYKWLNSNTGKLQNSGDPNVVTPYIEVEVGKTYTFSGIGDLQIRVFGYANLTDNKLVTYINNVRDQRTFTAQYPYMRASIGGGDAVSVLDAIQCEEGDTATSFEPYNTIELCKIGNYQDYIYKSGDDWYVHKDIGKAVLNGSENWSSRTNLSDTLQMTAPITSEGILDGNIQKLCNYGRYSNSAYNYGGIGDFNVLYNTKVFLIGVAAGTTVDSFQTMLSSNNLITYYPLATPTDTKIINESLISQLNALDRAALPQPVAYLSVDGDLPGELKISYYGEEE